MEDVVRTAFQLVELDILLIPNLVVEVDEADGARPTDLVYEEEHTEILWGLVYSFLYFLPPIDQVVVILGNAHDEVNEVKTAEKPVHFVDHNSRDRLVILVYAFQFAVPEVHVFDVFLEAPQQKEVQN